MITKSTLDVISTFLKSLEEFPFKGRFKSGMFEVPGESYNSRVKVFVKIEGEGGNAKVSVSFPDEEAADTDEAYKALKELADD